ncbi:MAG: hypothetical protein HY966_03205 [Ignavibacteriales bacterium]|nr:hypothetical protein [Ignavibacteriales bacterium]
MFFLLLLVSFVIALAVCALVARMFAKPVTAILQRLITEEVHQAWSKYLMFALYVVGISGGVRVWELQRYITPKSEGGTVLELTNERWVLEIYSTVIGTLQSIAWMLLIFFLFALIAYVIVKGQEMKRPIKN